MSRIGAPRTRTTVLPSHQSIQSLAGRRFQGCMPKKMTAHKMVIAPDDASNPRADSAGACQRSHGSMCVSTDKISINKNNPATCITGSANIGSPLSGPDWEVCACVVADPESVPCVRLSIDECPEDKCTGRNEGGSGAETGGWICSESAIFAAVLWFFARAF